MKNEGGKPRCSKNNSKPQGFKASQKARNVVRNKVIFDEVVCLSFSLVCVRVLVMFIGLFQCLFFSVSDNLVMPGEMIDENVLLGSPYSFVCFSNLC